MIGDRTRVRRFVVIRVAKSDREGSDRPVRTRLHQRDHEEESIPPERNAPSGTSDTICRPAASEQGLEVVDKIVVGPAVEVALPRRRNGAKIPVACEFGLAVRADRQDMRRRQLEARSGRWCGERRCRRRRGTRRPRPDRSASGIAGGGATRAIRIRTRRSRRRASTSRAASRPSGRERARAAAHGGPTARARRCR